MKKEIALEKRDLILDIAEKLFANHGFEAVSIRMLAKEADINLAMISYYFGSKEKLYEAVIERRFVNIGDAVPSLLDEDGDYFEKMYAVIDMYVNKFFSDRSFQQIIYREMSTDTRTDFAHYLVSKWHTNFKTLVGVLKKGMKKKVFREVDAELTLLSIIGTAKMFVNSPAMAAKCTDEKDETKLYGEKYKKRLKLHLRDLIWHHLRF